MPRPRTKSDQEIFKATAEALAQMGPDGLTLAEIGTRAGVSPATLVQRFSNKRGLLLAFTDHALIEADQFYSTCPEKAGLQQIQWLVEHLADGLDAGNALLNHFAFFQLDLRDDTFREKAAVARQQFCNQIEMNLKAAISNNEIAPCDTAQLADAIRVSIDGVMFGWLIDRKGQINRRLGRQIKLLLQPYLAQ